MFEIPEFVTLSRQINQTLSSNPARNVEPFSRRSSTWARRVISSRSARGNTRRV
jgi:hypothetical protein